MTSLYRIPAELSRVKFFFLGVYRQWKSCYDEAMNSLFIALVLLGSAVALAAQGRLPVTDKAPVVDGVVTEGEYALRVGLDKATLYLSRTATELYAAVQSNSGGWVALGAGSPRMDGARIYIGFVKGGEASFAVQAGAGHGHADAKDPAVLEHALKEVNGVTVLELRLDAKALIAAGQASLKLIVGTSGKDSFAMYHSFRRSLEIGL